MDGLNGEGKALVRLAQSLAGAVDGEAGRVERWSRGYFLRVLWRNERRTLIVARGDRRPSQEEALVARLAAGSPEECEGLPGKVWVTPETGGVALPVLSVEFHWTAERVPVRQGA